MSRQSTPPARAVDPVALEHLLRRLARTGRAPWLHQEVARRMAERLRLIRQPPRHWIDWWGQLGGGAQAVAEVWPDAERLAAEPGPQWVGLSRSSQRAPWWRLGLGRPPDRSVRLVGEVEAGRAQMVWANMMLHASPDPSATMARWHHALAEGGFLMFSTLGPHTLSELRELYAERGWPPPHPPFIDMHDLGDALVHAGFAEPVMDQEQITLSWSSPQALIDELRSLGANLDAGRPAGLRTPRWREQLLHALAERANAKGRIALRFEVVYGHAFKAPPRVAPGDTATVSLQSLRTKLTGPRRAEGIAERPAGGGEAGPLLSSNSR